MRARARCLAVSGVLSLLVGWLTPAAMGAEGWKYDWNVRTDRDGKPAGCYEVTPCPVTEASTSYSITNDEGAKTYQLGDKFLRYLTAVEGRFAGAHHCQAPVVLGQELSLDINKGRVVVYLL